jgi:hypothetical protein
MSDFEVHNIGTSRELKLSRDLAQEIDQVLRQYGNVIPENIINAYMKLKEYYALQIESESLA